MPPVMTLVFFFIFAFLIAGLLGSKRKIGFGWSLAACLLLSPLIGLIITLCSSKLPAEQTSNNADEEKPLADVLAESNTSAESVNASSKTSSVDNNSHESTNIDY